MKTLCITGMSEPDLLQIEVLLQGAGMAQPRSTERGPGLNMKEWHNRFFGNAEEDVPAKNRLLPGKFGEQLASEIFFANMEAPLWGWHDSRSNWLLDFWADFDPRLMFLLVCSPLDYQLARTMETESSQPLCVDEVVTAWQNYHEQLLGFYHRFPERCLLVDVCDCSTQFEALSQHCHTKWNLPLVVESEETGTQFSAPDHLARHLAKDFLHNQPEAVSLWNELKATLTNLSSSTESASLQLSDVVASFRELRDRSSEHRQIATLGQKNSDLRHQLESLSSRKQETEQALTALQRQLAELTKERDNLKTDLTSHVQKLHSLEEQQRETSEENELLLLQLHQVQEELESIFLQNQQAEKSWSTEREQLKKETADLATSFEKITDQAEGRWQRLRQRQPDYYDYHSLTVAPGDKPSSLIWQISNLEIGSRYFPDLQFETFLLGGVSGFRFTRPGEDNVSKTSPLLRWPLETEGSQQIDLIPVAESRQDVNRRVNALKGLTASDWSLLQSLALFLKARLQDTGVEAGLPAALRTASMAGFDSFLKVIENFPTSLRYDRVTLEKENCSEDCEQLELAIENLNHGELQCPRFEFRLSCAGLQSSDFGSHPRLEFPADTSTVLKSWFDCSDDPEDPRLELRFAVPNAMDIDVWHKLSEEDAGFILMLVQHLPLMLDELRCSDIGLNRSWDQWLSLSGDVEQILQLRNAPAKSEEAA